MRVLDEKVLLLPIEKTTQTKSGIYLPPSETNENIIEAKVIQVGEGKRFFDTVTQKFSHSPLRVKINDIVLIPKYLPSFTHERQEYYVVEEHQITAILEKDEGPEGGGSEARDEVAAKESEKSFIDA